MHEHDTLDALQAIAAYHRSHFSIPVIGITGSNGKTVVKEWLYHLLKDDFIICRSPRSFNSQIGVPMSIWQLRPEHTLAIIEAGISSEGEMERLYQIIQPTIGVLTNIGEAHSEGFKSRDQKISEKIKLFRSAEVVVYGSDNLDVRDAMKTLPAKDSRQSHTKTFDWGLNGEALKLIGIKKSGLVSSIDLQVDEKKFTLEIPFTDDASIENAITCCCVMLLLKYEVGTIAKKMKTLSAVDMIQVLPKKEGLCVFATRPLRNCVAGNAAPLNPRLMRMLPPLIHPWSSLTASVNCLYIFPSLVKTLMVPGM